MVELKIDPEFRDKIPAMPNEDFDGLRADIIRDGYVRDPLVVWKEENTLLDGHHRWRVIQENLELLGDKFTVDYKSFPDRWAAIAWICANQLHKHNMTELQRMKLIQEQSDAEQKSMQRDEFGRFAPSGENHLAVKNPHRKKIAEEHNISENVVRTAVEVGRGIDRAAEVDPEFKREVLSGEVKAKKSDLAEIRKMQSDEEVKEAIEGIRDPSKKRGGGATRELRDRYNMIDEIAHKMGNEQTETTFDDVIRLLNSIGDDFIAKVERTIESEREKLSADERWPTAIEGYFDSVIADITEFKRRIIK